MSITVGSRADWFYSPASSGSVYRFTQNGKRLWEGVLTYMDNANLTDAKTRTANGVTTRGVFPCYIAMLCLQYTFNHVMAGFCADHPGLDWELNANTGGSLYGPALLLKYSTPGIPNGKVVVESIDMVGFCQDIEGTAFTLYPVPGEWIEPRCRSIGASLSSNPPYSSLLESMKAKALA